MKAKQLIVYITTLVFILLFTYTATDKWLHFEQFVKTMNAQAFNARFTPFLVFGLPAVELLVSAILLFPKTRMLGLYSATLLMAIFTIYIGLGLLHIYDRVPCSCGGIFETFTWKEHFIFNLVLTGIGIISIRFEKLNLSFNSMRSGVQL